MTERMVNCVKLGKTLPGLEKPPFQGELGKKIFDNVSKEAWQMWKEAQIRVLNEYRLNMGDPKDHKIMIEQMMVFLNLKEGQEMEVQDASRGKG